MEARIGLPVDGVSGLVEGATYNLKAGDVHYSAVFRSAAGVVNDVNRTVECVFDFIDKAPPAGAVVRLASPKTIEERGFWAPVSALSQASRGMWSIYVVRQQDNNWVTEPHLVEIIHAEASRVYVRGTVEDGAYYVSNGLQRVTPGMTVSLPENVVGEGA